MSERKQVAMECECVRVHLGVDGGGMVIDVVLVV